MKLNEPFFFRSLSLSTLKYNSSLTEVRDELKLFRETVLNRPKVDNNIESHKTAQIHKGAYDSSVME